MSKIKLTMVVMVTMALVGLWAGLAHSQEEQRTERRDEGRSRDRMTDFRQRMSERLKEQLEVKDDEEWKVLQPRIEKVTMLQFQSRIGGMWTGRRTSGSSADRPETPLSKAASELRAALEDKSSSNDTIKAKLQALRQARVKAQEELAQAQKELRELLSLRQESTLVMMGVLD